MDRSIQREQLATAIRHDRPATPASRQHHSTGSHIIRKRTSSREQISNRTRETLAEILDDHSRRPQQRIKPLPTQRIRNPARAQRQRRRRNDDHIALLDRRSDHRPGIDRLTRNRVLDRRSVEDPPADHQRSGRAPLLTRQRRPSSGHLMRRQTTRQRRERSKRLIRTRDRPSVLISQPRQRRRQLHRIKLIDETVKLSTQVIAHATECTPAPSTSTGKAPGPRLHRHGPLVTLPQPDVICDVPAAWGSEGERITAE